ncbi:MAG: 50S ribosomal protein L25/general stress protein Ctc [Dongiaceae bacterium]
MTEVQMLKVEPRERAGKGAARAVRRAGSVPAVVYGLKQPPVLVSVEPRELTRQLNKSGFFATLIDLEIGGKKERVIPRDVQFDPVNDRPIHADFMRVGKDTKLYVNVPVHFFNHEAAPGIKRGGVLNVVRHQIELICSPENIPQSIEIDLTDLEIGDGVHISIVKLPEGVRPAIADRDFTIATIAAPSAIRMEAQEAAEAAAAAEAATAAAEGVPAAGDTVEGEKKEEAEKGEKKDSKS